MPIEKFRLPRSSYEELCKIIMGYSNFPEAASLSEVAQACGINTTKISDNNSFLTAVEIVQGGKKKSITDTGRKLAIALDHGIEDEIQNAWKEVAEKNEFLSKMVTAVRIRKTMGTSDLVSHIAYSSGEPKKGYVMTGARAVVDIFKAAGLVEEKDDRFIPKEKTPVGVEEAPAKEHKEEQKIGISGFGEGPVSLNIQVRIDAKPSELDGLGEKLRGLIESLKEGGESKGRQSE